ncbi:MAG: type I-B CRISPR-associated protein Cas7/Csh2 [Candidatus Coatesbacteria bacterium]|nr:type I-B CRISPR-associated protein Cas7/Csh2 [Candidatus Coatesbacteria bacterium]
MSDYNTRSELLFLYDVKDANPNGDPLDENKPRIDEASGRNFVTDVRLKRTIRDFLYKHKGREIFVRRIEKADGNIQDAKERAQDFETKAERIIGECIDIRLFGGTIPTEVEKVDKNGKVKMKGGKPQTETGSITLTGPVQFKIGRSLHPVELRFIRGTGAFASGSTSKQRTFRDEYILPYSLVAFHGIVNQVSGRFSDYYKKVADNLKKEDIDLLLEGIWHGTGNLISRSKMGQLPRLLLKLDYKDEHLFIGDLDHLVELDAGEKPPVEVRSPEDYTVKLDRLVELVQGRFGSKIDKLRYAHDDRVILTLNGEPTTIPEAFSDLNVEPLPFHPA